MRSFLVSANTSESGSGWTVNDYALCAGDSLRFTPKRKGYLQLLENADIALSTYRDSAVFLAVVGE